MAKRAKSKSRSFYIEALKSRGAKGRLSKMKKTELEKLYNKTMPGTEHGEDHDGPKTDHDGQQGDGYGLSLAPDPRAQKGAGHCSPDMVRSKTEHISHRTVRIAHVSGTEFPLENCAPICLDKNSRDRLGRR